MGSLLKICLIYYKETISPRGGVPQGLGHLFTLPLT